MSARTFIAGCTLIASSALGAQARTVSGAFVSMLGSDTVQVERYTRTGGKLEGEILTRFPGVQVTRYVADLGDGKFRAMSVATRSVSSDPAAPALFSMVTIIGDSTATIEVQRSGRADTVSSTRRTFRGQSSPSIPGLPAAVGLYEQIIAFNHPVGRDTTRVAVLGPGAGPNASLSLVRRARDTIILVSSLSPGWIEVAAVDAGGRITRLDARATTVKTVTSRASELDFDAIAGNWAAVELARGRAGRMSPPDTVRATLGNAVVEIAYSRPFKRGRDVWGTVVEWGKPWRTGANAATQLTTSADLVFGTTVVPAGKYTLWSLPAPGGARLIINSQTGQWGTVYDASRDLARLDMTQVMLAQPVEQFTISIVPRGSGGVLRFSWDNREFSIPFRAR